jgi:predicted small lipoprotein YifL
MHSIKHFSFLFLSFLLSIQLSACGSKGNLYQAEALETKNKSVTEVAKPRIDNTKKKQS